MNVDKKYEQWKAITESDFVTLFIKTWFAYISTLRVMFPEAANRRGDKKYLNCYKDFYKKTGYKKFIIDEILMGNLENLYANGRTVIMRKYPEYYLWDFYRVNKDFEYIFKDIPPDKSDCLVFNMKLLRNRGTAHSFKIYGFIQFFGTYHNIKYDQHVDYSLDITSILKDAEKQIRDNPTISEQDFMSWITTSISSELAHAINIGFTNVSSDIETKYGKRMMIKTQKTLQHVIQLCWQIFSLNTKDESAKTLDEMNKSRNSYEVIQQRPLNYFIYHRDVEWQPQRALSASEEKWYRELLEIRKQNSIIWFLDFVYRLRNALFHEIIDPLNEEWQVIFKSAYLVLKEIVDLNINELESK